MKTNRESVKFRDSINLLGKELQSLKKRIWALENPAKFNLLDEVIIKRFYIEWDPLDDIYRGAVTGINEGDGWRTYEIVLLQDIEPDVVYRTQALKKGDKKKIDEDCLRPSPSRGQIADGDNLNKEYESLS